MTVQYHSFAASGVSVRELPPVRRYSLRLRAGSADAAAAALGFELPDRIGRIAAAGSRRALCLGPDEWLIETPEADEVPALPAGLPHALVDVSDRELHFRIEGPRALELLSLGVARDLGRIASGTGRRTAFDGVQVILIRESDTAFTMSVWRSFAPHVAGLLAIGQRELASGF